MTKLIKCNIKKKKRLLTNKLQYFLFQQLKKKNIIMVINVLFFHCKLKVTVITLDPLLVKLYSQLGKHFGKLTITMAMNSVNRINHKVLYETDRCLTSVNMLFIQVWVPCWAKMILGLSSLRRTHWNFTFTLQTILLTQET